MFGKTPGVVAAFNTGRFFLTPLLYVTFTLSRLTAAKRYLYPQQHRQTPFPESLLLHRTLVCYYGFFLAQVY